MFLSRAFVIVPKNSYYTELKLLFGFFAQYASTNTNFQMVQMLLMAKRVRDVEGGVSQCGEQRSTKRSEARNSPTRRETPKKYYCFKC
jgi:hypothetical protein